MACAVAIMSVSPPVTRNFSLSGDQNDKYIIIFTATILVTCFYRLKTKKKQFSMSQVCIGVVTDTVDSGNM